MAEVTVTGNLKGLLSFDRQVKFAAARSLTKTAKQGQSASVKSIERTFTTRNKWYLPGSPLGVKVTPATKDKLESSVRSAADFLAPHETGGVKTPEGNFIAIPTSNVRRNKRQIIPRALRPRKLKGGFVVVLGQGTSKSTRRRRLKGLTPFAARAGKAGSGTRILFQRTGKTVRAMYILEPRARIKKQSTVIEPTLAVVERRFSPNFGEALREALETAR